MTYEKVTKWYTYREIAEADIEELIDNSLLYECYEEGVLIDIPLHNHCPEDTDETRSAYDESPYRLRLVGHFDNESIIEYAKENYDINLDLETLGPWYQEHDLEVDSYFLEQEREQCIYSHLQEFTRVYNCVTFNDTEYVLLENAYAIENVTDHHDYEAMSMGLDKKYYMVKWDMLPDMENESDGGKICDWDYPADVKRVEL